MEAAGTQIDSAADARMAKAAKITEHLERSLAATAPEISQRGVLAGPLRRAMPPEAAEYGWGEDNLHFPLDVRNLLALGAPGIAATARANAERLSGERAHYLQCVARTFDAVSAFLARHAELAEVQMPGAAAAERQRLAAIAENCRVLAAGPPRTFAQAAQLFWFVYCLRGFGGIASTIGRLDQHLQPFYQADVAAGRLTRDEALEILCELWRGFNRVVSHPVQGLMTLMIGGQDAAGHDATCDVSYLILDTALKVNDTNPFVCARIHSLAPEAFIDKVVDLLLVGQGQGTIYNDDQIIPSLVRYGVPVELARNYAGDGCNEVTIDGQSTLSMVAVDALKCLELALFNGKENPSAGQAPRRILLAADKPYSHRDDPQLGYASGDFEKMTSFQEFLDAYLRQYFRRIDQWLGWQNQGLKAAAEQGVFSPLTAGTFATVLATGRDPYRGGVELPEQLIFLGSLGTVGDSLAAVRRVVFDDKACTPRELLDAIRADWKGHEPLRRRCLAAPKFGNDDDYVDSIVADVVRRTVDHVKAHPSHSGKPIWPCLFNHTYTVTAQTCGATPDGRRWMDPVGEHFSPTPGRAVHGPTAVLRSATKAPLADCVGVAIFQIAMSRGTVPRSAAGHARLKNLLRTGLKLGVTEMNTAVYDVAALKDAKVHPEKHPDLIVRVWGFSARFVSLAEEMQDHIIARTIQGQDG